jgi:hypothetical protein
VQLEELDGDRDSEIKIKINCHLLSEYLTPGLNQTLSMLPEYLLRKYCFP